MKELLGEQERLLPKGCKTLVFEFPFVFHAECKFYLIYNNEMNKEDVDYSEMYPVDVQLSENAVFYSFKPSVEDRLFQLEVWSDDTED